MLRETPDGKKMVPDAKKGSLLNGALIVSGSLMAQRAPVAQMSPDIQRDP